MAHAKSGLEQRIGGADAFRGLRQASGPSMSSPWWQAFTCRYAERNKRAPSTQAERGEPAIVELSANKTIVDRTWAVLCTPVTRAGLLRHRRCPGLLTRSVGSVQNRVPATWVRGQNGCGGGDAGVTECSGFNACREDHTRAGFLKVVPVGQTGGRRGVFLRCSVVITSTVIGRSMLRVATVAVVVEETSGVD